MTFDISKEKKTLLSAFVGRSFLDGDKGVWYEFRDMLDSLKPMGFDHEDAKEAQIRPISDKVKELINRHDIYIGILTKRDPIWEMPKTWQKRWLCPLGLYEPKKWTTSEWVIEEIGYAIGKDRKILLLIEKDVNFPVADLDGDTQWVPFNRGKISESQKEINQMILNLISERVVSKIEPTAIATATPSSPATVAEPQKPSFREQFETLQKEVSNGNFPEAERIQENIIAEEPVAAMKIFFESFLLSIRAKGNDTGALSLLKRRCEENSDDYNAVQELADVYSSFGQFKQAAELIVSHLDTVPINQRSNLVIMASKEKCKDGKAAEAISLLLAGLQKESEESKKVSIYREIASVAKKINDPDLESAFLERVLKIVPSDNDSRFRLAVVYSNNNLNQLAAYHYQIITKHTAWPSAFNNLGVAYGELGFKANEYKSFKDVAERYPLAKANIASLYENAGILSEAGNLAKAVASISENESDAQIAISRARYVLDQIESKAKTEKESIDQIAANTKNEREFMSAYAEAYCAPSLGNDRGIFTTVHGDLDIIRENLSLKAEGRVTKTSSRNAMRSLMTMADMLSAGPETTFVSLSAQLHGQSGIFELKITPEVKSGGLLENQSLVIRGLLYFEDSGNVIKFLERHDEKRKRVTSARRKP